MSNIRHTIWVFLFTLGIVSCSINRLEEPGQHYVELSQAEYIHIIESAKTILWDPNHFRTNEEIAQALITLSQSQNFSKSVANTLKLYKTETFNNKELQRSIQILTNLGTLSLDFAEFEKLSESIVKMKKFSIEKVVCSYRDQSVCNMAMLPDIRQVYMNSEDSNELEYYWKAWRTQMEDNMRDTLGIYLDLYKNSSIINGFQKPSHQWYARHENVNFLGELTSIMEQLRPVYKELHAYIRKVLDEKYESLIDIEGAIPQHLLDQVIIQSWNRDGIVKDPYPNTYPINMNFDEESITTFKMVEIANEYFKSLGFEDLPQTFWSTYTQMIPHNEAGPDCKSKVFDFYTDVALKYCPNPNFKTFLQIHGDMASVHYINQKKHLPFGLRDEPVPGFSKAISEATILSASVPKHKQNIRLGYNTEEKLNINRLFRLGIHTLLQIPLYYVHEKIWVDLLDDVIQLENVNCKYWQYMWDYMGVIPPVDRSIRNIDFGYRFYEGLDERKPHSTEIISELLGYQFYKGLCEKSGQYRRNDRSLILQNCDFYGSHEAGNALKEMMKNGSKKPWFEQIMPLTGGAFIYADEILEFYEPLYNWLREENQRTNTVIGWRKIRSSLLKRCSKYL